MTHNVNPVKNIPSSEEGESTQSKLPKIRRPYEEVEIKIPGTVLIQKNVEPVQQTAEPYALPSTKIPARHDVVSSQSTQVQHSNQIFTETIKANPAHFQRMLLSNAIDTDDLQLCSALLNGGAALEELDMTRRKAIFYKAMQANHADLINILLIKDALKTVPPEYKQSVFIWASEVGNLEAVKFLIDKGVNLAYKDNSGNTPLILAGSYGYVEIVKLLVKSRADIEAQNSLGFTALLGACMAQNVEVVRVLVDNGANLGWVKTAKEGSNINDAIKEGSYVEYSPLQLSIMRSDFAICDILIAAGKEAFAPVNEGGISALVLAVYEKSVKLVSALLKAGADLNVKDLDGATPLHFAILRDDAGIVQVLLDFKPALDDKHIIRSIFSNACAVNNNHIMVLLQDYCVTDTQHPDDLCYKLAGCSANSLKATYDE
jgi:ankyrin repeat protein